MPPRGAEKGKYSLASQYRRVEGRPGEHILPVPPHAVFYVIEGGTLVVLGHVDSRLRRER